MRYITTIKVVYFKADGKRHTSSVFTQPDGKQYVLDADGILTLDKINILEVQTETTHF